MNKRKVIGYEKAVDYEKDQGAFNGKANCGCVKGTCEDCVSKGARDHRVCDPRGGSCCHCHTCDNDIPPKTRRALGRNNFGHTGIIEKYGWGRAHKEAADRHFRLVLSGLKDNQRGQSSVEFAVVMAAGMCIVIALGALVSALDSGIFIEHAATSISHSISTIVGGAADVFSY